MFGQVLREFGVKVSLAFDGKKVEEAEDRINKFAGKLRGFALEVAGATAGIFEFQNLFTSNARSLENQANLLGISTEALQEYEYAAKVAADVNRDDLASSLQQLGYTMDKARAGDIEARMALEQIGGASGNLNLIIGRLNDRTYKVTDAFHDMSVGIQNISKNAPQAASRLTEMTLGNAKLYNLLRQGPKAIDQLTEEGRKNFALNERMIRQGYLMDIQMSKLWMTFRKFGYEIGFSVMKHLTPMINQFTKWFSVNRLLIESGINKFLDALANGLKIVWSDSLMLVKVLGPVVGALGGAKNAVNLLIGAWLAYKGIEIAASFISLVSAILKVIPVITVIKDLAGALKSLEMIETIADVLPAIELFGAGSLAALAPLVPIIAAIAAGAVAIHDISTVLSGGQFKDTWTGKGVEKLEGVGQWVNKNVTGGAEAFAGAGPYGNVSPTGGASAWGGGVTQENHFETTQTIMVPPGTSAPAAASMISRATVESNERMMVKAKQDAARSRVY